MKTIRYIGYCCALLFPIYVHADECRVAHRPAIRAATNLNPGFLIVKLADLASDDQQLILGSRTPKNNACVGVVSGRFVSRAISTAVLLRQDVPGSMDKRFRLVTISGAAKQSEVLSWSSNKTPILRSLIRGAHRVLDATNGNSKKVRFEHDAIVVETIEASSVALVWNGSRFVEFSLSI